MTAVDFSQWLIIYHTWHRVWFHHVEQHNRCHSRNIPKETCISCKLQSTFFPSFLQNYDCEPPTSRQVLHILKIILNTQWSSCLEISLRHMESHSLSHTCISCIPIYIQQDAIIHNLLYLETCLHVSGGTTTHHQERIQLYLQHLVFVKPLLLPAANVELFHNSSK